MISLDYEELLDRFGISLRENLRLTGISDPMFELWVPDDDPVRSIESLLHSIDQTNPGQEIEITVPAARLNRTQVRAIAGLFGGALKIERADQKALWRVMRSGSGTAAASSAKPPSETKQTIRDVSAESDRPKPAMLNTNAVAEPALPLPLAAFLVERAAKGGKHSLSATPTATGAYRFTDGAITLAVRTDATGNTDLDSRIVTAIRHHGAETGTSLCGLLDMLCEIAPGLPVSEVADHGAVRLAEACCAAVPAAKPVALGASLTFTPEFRAVTQLLRQLPGMRERADYTPGYSPRPSNDWLGATAEKRLSRIAGAMTAFCATQQLPADAVHPIAVLDDLSGWPVRAVVTCSDAVAPSARPSLIRALECILKQEVEPSLTVLYEARRDSNKIRRL